MIYSRSRNRVRLVCALLATTVIPVLAFAGIDNGKGNNGQNNGKQNGHARQVGPDLRAGRSPAGTLQRNNKTIRHIALQIFDLSLFRSLQLLRAHRDLRASLLSPS
jgi:hypothetical protein